MKKDKIYSVYINTNSGNTTFYIGVTSGLLGRSWKHKKKYFQDSFSARYNLTKLVYYQSFPTMIEAIAEEKRLKRWRRQWKINLIKKGNPRLEDLSKDWFDDENP